MAGDGPIGEPGAGAGPRLATVPMAGSSGGEGGEGGALRVARRVYVGNLSWRTTWQQLKDVFSRAGAVRYADVLRDGGGPGARSKGCGIVEFESPEAAAAAIEALNGAELDGRVIFVREDREDYELRQAAGGGTGAGGEAGRPERPEWPERPPPRRRAPAPPGGAADAPAAGGPAVSVGRRVWVGNLAPETEWQQLKDHFRQAGPVLHAGVLEDGEGRSKGCGVVEFAEPALALRAISLLSNSELGGRRIVVREDREDPALAGGAERGRLRGGAPPSAEGRAVVVHGLPFAFAWQDLKDLCRQAGGVARADIAANPDGSSRGFGVVQFAAPADAAAAIRLLNGRVVDGRVLTARLDRYAGAPPPGPPPGPPPF